MNLAAAFAASAQRQPDKIALYWGESEFSYATLFAQSGAVAAALTGRFGVRPGDRVGLWLKNRPEFVPGVFGILGGIGTHPEDVMMMKRTADRLLGDNYEWSALGAGASQMRIAAQVLAMGGNVRVGMEDSLWVGSGQLAESNAQQVTKVRKIVEGLGLEVASPDEAREILALKGGDKVNF